LNELNISHEPVSGGPVPSKRQDFINQQQLSDDEKFRFGYWRLKLSEFLGPEDSRTTAATNFLDLGADKWKNLFATDF
jgi:hypothetical protein